MLKEFAQFLCDQAKAGQFPKIIKCEKDPPEVVRVIHANGGFSIERSEPAHREHEPADLQTIFDFVRGVIHDDVVYANASCWFDRSGVSVYLDDAIRRDTLSMSLGLSSTIGLLVGFEANDILLDQRQFLSLFRIKLAGCFPSCPAIVQILTKVKFRADQAGEAEIQHGKSSIGRSIRSELTGTASIPESIVLNVPCLCGYGLKYRADVPCALEIDSQQEKFWLSPYPGACELAIRDCERQLGSDLWAGFESMEIPVFYGKP